MKRGAGRCSGPSPEREKAGQALPRPQELYCPADRRNDVQTVTVEARAGLPVNHTRRLRAPDSVRQKGR